MILSGGGITTPVPLNVLKGFTYDIATSYKWMKLGDGSHTAPDRGETQDHITCKLRTHGREQYIDDIITALDDNINASAELELSDVTAPIFGHHVDYTQDVSAVFTKAKPRKQKTLNGYSLDIELEAAQITFLPLNPVVLPELIYMEHTAQADTSWDFSVNRSYKNEASGGLISLHRMGRDSGTFKGTFKMDYQTLGDLLNFQRLNRVAAFDMPVICGIDNPFGVRGGTVGLKAKLYSIDRVRYLSPSYYGVEITFVQDF